MIEHRTMNIEHKTKNKILKNKFSILGFRVSVNLGFTLLELIVVIAIISILSTIGINSFTAAQRRSRDAKRMTDIREIQTALEQYYSICGYLYPTLIPGGFYNSINCPAPPISIMPMVPVDPKPPSMTPYYCQTTCDGSIYTVCAALEAGTSPTFCVSNQQ